MHGFLKLVGVPAEALSGLHQAVKDHGKVNLPYGTLDRNEEEKYISIESSKLAEYGTYTVTLKINWWVSAKMESSTCLGKHVYFDFFSYLSMPAFKAVMSSIDPYIMGELENRVPYGNSPEKRKDMDRAERMMELEKLRGSMTKQINHLLEKIEGEPLAQDIVATDGLVVLRKEDGVRKGIAHYLNPVFGDHKADFVLDGHTKKVSQVLIEIGKIYAPYKKREEEIEAEFAE